MDSSPLGRLSPEVRNMIYGLVLVDPEPIHLRWWCDDRIHQDKAYDYVQLLALPMTCRQLHSECTGLFYASNRFVVRTLSLIHDKLSKYWADSRDCNALDRFCSNAGVSNVHLMCDFSVNRVSPWNFYRTAKEHGFYQSLEHIGCGEALKTITLKIELLNYDACFISSEFLKGDARLITHVIRLQRRSAHRRYRLEFGAVYESRSSEPLYFNLELHKPKEEAERLRAAAEVTQFTRHKTLNLLVASWLEAKFREDYCLPTAPTDKEWDEWLEPI